MSNSTLEKKVFDDGIASDLIGRVVANLPNIMFVCSLVIRAVIGYLLWMHAMSLFSYIKNEKTQWLVATLFVGATEMMFTTFSLASAKLRKDGGGLKNEGSKKELRKDGDSHKKRLVTQVTNRVTYNQGKKLLTWANILFIVTLIGSFGFNALMLSWAHSLPYTEYFNAVSNKTEVFVFVQFMNILAVFGSEGAAFILNVSADSNGKRKMKVTHNSFEGIDSSDPFNLDDINDIKNDISGATGT